MKARASCGTRPPREPCASTRIPRSWCSTWQRSAATSTRPHETRDSKKARGRGKRGWQQALEAECKTRDVLGKDCGRPIAKALARLLMRAPTGATLVARAPLAGIALKLALSRDPHAASCNVSRVVLVEPTLSAVAVNGLLACKTPPARRITVDAAFADDDAQMRRGPAIAAACGEGISCIAPDDGGDAVLRAFLPRADDDAGGVGRSGLRRRGLARPAPALC